VGYDVDHDGDCYEMLDVNGGTIYVTRDLVWLQRMYSTSPLLMMMKTTELICQLIMPSDVGVRESNPLAANDHEDDDGVIPHNNEDDTDDHTAEVIEGVAEGEMNIDAATTTRSGRSVSALTYLNAYELGNIQHEIKLTS
jgi:hypothetical protein